MSLPRDYRGMLYRFDLATKYDSVPSLVQHMMDETVIDGILELRMITSTSTTVAGTSGEFTRLRPSDLASFHQGFNHPPINSSIPGSNDFTLPFQKRYAPPTAPTKIFSSSVECLPSEGEPTVPDLAMMTSASDMGSVYEPNVPRLSSIFTSFWPEGQEVDAVACPSQVPRTDSLPSASSTMTRLHLMDLTLSKEDVDFWVDATRLDAENPGVPLVCLLSACTPTPRKPSALKTHLYFHYKIKRTLCPKLSIPYVDESAI